MWFINQVAAQILRDTYGYTLRTGIPSTPIRGEWCGTESPKTLRRLPQHVRLPRYQLTAEQVIELELLPNEEAIKAYVEAVGKDRFPRPSDA